MPQNPGRDDGESWSRALREMSASMEAALRLADAIRRNGLEHFDQELLGRLYASAGAPFGPSGQPLWLEFSIGSALLTTSS